MPTAYETLARIAADNPQLLVAYKNDLHKHDRNSLEEAAPGSWYIWLLRDSGTQLFPLNNSRDHVWLTYWIREASPENPPKAYSVVVRGGGDDLVHEISLQVAEELAVKYGNPQSQCPSLS